MAKKPAARARTAKPAKGGADAGKGAGARASAKGSSKPAGKAPGAKAAGKPTSAKPAKAPAKPATKGSAKVSAKASAKGSAKSATSKPVTPKAAASKGVAPKAPGAIAAKAAPKPTDAAGKKAPVKAPAGKAPATPAKGDAGAKGATPKAATPAAVAPGATGGAAAAGEGDAKGGRKGITIVNNKPRRTGPRQEKIQIPKMEPLLGPGSPLRKPLIASGPGAVRQSLEIDPESLAKLKSPFGKKDLQRFRDILLKKRADLVGDVSDLDSEALLGRSGSLSALPQHIAEQGSETYEQSLSLNLAAEDRRLIREIDAALQRIDKGTFGICEMTGKAISRDRLEELPWTRYSIEAARESERRSLGGR